MSDFVLRATRYAISGDVNIAYQTMGDGPVDLIFIPGVVSHVEFLHEIPCVYRKLKLGRSGGEVRQGWRVI